MVSPKVTSTRRPIGLSTSRRDDSGELEITVRPSATVIVIENTALNSGSSRQGNARRQSVDCIWVVAITCSTPSPSMKVDR